MLLAKLATGLALGALMITAAPAAEFTVNLVNKDADGRIMQFEPAFLKVAPGDVVHFVAKDKGHDSESLVVPEGAEGWKSAMSQNIDVTFTAAGLYAFKCAPHLPLGMVGLIEVGDSVANADAIKALKLPGKAATRMTELLGAAGVQ